MLVCKVGLGRALNQGDGWAERGTSRFSFRLSVWAPFPTQGLPLAGWERGCSLDWADWGYLCISHAVESLRKVRVFALEPDFQGLNVYRGALRRASQCGCQRLGISCLGQSSCQFGQSVFWISSREGSFADLTQSERVKPHVIARPGQAP